MPSRFARLLVIAAAGMVAVASVSGITLAELRRNELWLPASTKLAREISFSDGTKLRAGEVVAVHKLAGNNVEVLTSQGSLLALAIADTSLIADATARVAMLTPAQQKLTPATIRTRRELWPYWVTFRQPQEFSDGTKFKAGEKLALSDFDGRKVKLVELKKNIAYSFDPAETDFFDACLAAVETPGASRLHQEIAAYSVDATTLKPADFLADGGPEYLAIYHAANWCPFCAQTSPDVVEWFSEVKKSGDTRFQLLIVSNDKSAAEFKTHLSKLGVSALAVPPEWAPKLFVLNGTANTRGLPNFYVVDRSGKLVVPGGQGQARERTLRVIEQIKAL